MQESDASPKTTYLKLCKCMNASDGDEFSFYESRALLSDFPKLYNTQ